MANSLFLIILAIYGFCLAATTKPIRVVSTNIFADEVLFALWSPLERQRRIVALSNLCSDPRFSNLTEQETQGFKRLDSSSLEKLVELKPDLVITSPYNRAELLHMMGELKVANLLLKDTRSLSDIRENIFAMAERLGADAAAKKLWAEMNAKLATIKRQQRPSALPITILNYNSEYGVFGKDTLFETIAREAGLKNLGGTIPGTKGWQPINSERMALLRPSFIVAEGEESERAALLKTMQTSQGWKEIPAVRQGKLIIIPSRLLFSTSHYVIQTIELLTQATHQP